jgi:hypothetical protein
MIFFSGKAGHIHVDDLCREHAEGQQKRPPILTKREANALRRRNEMRIHQPKDDP